MAVNSSESNGEALIEWRSSEQVENGIASTSPLYWDTDNDDYDDNCGPKPSELYGKYTWKIDKFSQINKRELRSNAFEVGGYKWYILIYPQGCDVSNHLSLFLCVANHDKLLPGWSHFAQFTIAVVNKDPKKSKYSDTLHRFWKKEHDWGWKKFMELSKVLDGFVDNDTLKIKAQVQVIRERVDRPFKCLDCQYRRELVRVYLSNVEQICRRFVEERRGRLGKLIEDKVRWSSFCNFWLGIDQNARRRMSREKSDVILKVAVKQFFIEKEVTSTLVMDSLYNGLKALEGQSQTNNKAKGKGKSLGVEQVAVPIVGIEKDTFTLVDDVLLLLERAALEPLPPKDEKGPQNRTKDGGSGEDFSKDSIERDERRLTELGRRTIEIFVLAHIFSKIEVAYQEVVALKRQEELIREEEEAWMTGIEQKSKREKDNKKSKKKQGKQKRNNRKVKDKAIREEKASAVVLEKHKPQVVVVESMEDDISDVSDSVNFVPLIQADSDERDSSPVNWDTDTSEPHPPIEEAARNLDDTSSTCSTDSLPFNKTPTKTTPTLNITTPQKPTGGSVDKSVVQPVVRPLSAPLVPQSSTTTTINTLTVGSTVNAMMGSLSTTSLTSQFSCHPLTSTPPVSLPQSLDSRSFLSGMTVNHRDNEFSSLSDEFPHLDIINDLLDDAVSPLFQSQHQLTYPVDQGLSCRFGYGGGFEVFPQQQQQTDVYVNGGLIQNNHRWQMSGSDVSYPSNSFRNMDDHDGMYDYHHHHHHHHHLDYSNNLMMGVNGYSVYHRPSNGQ